MMYQNKLVTALKVNGQILREQHGIVALPFGSEYAVLVKNLNSVRVKIRVSVDGTDATSGTWLVIAPNSSVELERFIRDGNWQSGNRFKFIERSAGIEAHRGIKADDGLVRVEHQTERVRLYVDVPIVRPHYYEWYPQPRPRPYWPYHQPQPWYGGAGSGGSTTFTNSVSTSNTGGAAGNTQTTNQSASQPTDCLAMNPEQQDQGITVAGSVSHQQFYAAQDFETTGETGVMILQLRGMIGRKAVKTAITVKTKRTCSSCGKAAKGPAEFCASCGTALTTV